MSNLIKYAFVNFDKKDAVVIGEEEKPFVPLAKKGRVKMRPADEVAAEQQEKKQVALQATEAEVASGEFVAGMPTINFDEVFNQKKKEAEALANTIIASAREQAVKIMDEAKVKADEVYEKAHEEGMQIGRREGLDAGQEELEKLRQNLKEEMRQKEKECEEYEASLEVKYTDVLCSLIQKLTGVLLSDRKDIMLYLIRSIIADIEPSKHYTIRVSSEDFVLVESHKEEIRVKLGNDVIVDVQEEKGLQKDQCIIETDHQMMDCGLQTQLDNLVSTLRMLAQ